MRDVPGLRPTNKPSVPKIINLRNFGYVRWIYGWRHIFPF
jgi:hypothetical protein